MCRHQGVSRCFLFVCRVLIHSVNKAILAKTRKWLVYNDLLFCKSSIVSHCLPHWINHYECIICSNICECFNWWYILTQNHQLIPSCSAPFLLYHWLIFVDSFSPTLSSHETETGDNKNAILQCNVSVLSSQMHKLHQFVLMSTQWKLS